MAFILGINRTSGRVREAFDKYASYLSSVREKFPPSAYQLATSDWYFGNGPRSPHDAWLESLKIEEKTTGNRKQVRQLQIHLKLIGAYHDGYISFLYPGVFRYEFGHSASPETHRELAHGDWLYDEFSLTERGNVLHEIEWQYGRWKIEAADVHYTWHPVGGESPKGTGTARIL